MAKNLRFVLFFGAIFTSVTFVIATNKISKILPQFVNICDPTIRVSGNYSSDELRKTLCDSEIDRKKFSSAPLSMLAQTLQQELSAQSVRVSFVSHQEINIRVIERVPILKLFLDDVLFAVSNELDVYRPQKMFESQSDLNEVHISTASFGVSKDELNNNFIRLTDLQKQIIGQAQQLSHFMKQYGMSQSKISFHNHRGFSIDKHQNFPEIVIGEQDFEERLKKLNSIFNEYGFDFSRIELDFTGKAFLIDRPTLAQKGGNPKL